MSSYDEIPAEILTLGPDFVQIWQLLPPLITREKFAEATGGAYRARHMANLDSKGQGPAQRVLVGPKVCYRRTEAVLWLASRTKAL